MQLRGRNRNKDVLNIKFTQINLGRRKQAPIDLSRRTSNDFFISLVQELHLLQSKKPSGLDPQHSISHALVDRPRQQYIIISYYLSGSIMTSAAWM